MIRAELVLQELRKLKVTHVVGLPDNTSAALIALLERDRDIRFITVTREGEAFAIAAGLWMGGKTPMVLIQNTGFLESGDAFRGTAMRMRIPLLCLITYRGYRKMGRLLTTDTSCVLDADTLSRADVDSAALVTEPTLKAWGLPFDFVHEEDDLRKIANAFGQAEALSRPVAILLTNDLG
jgi:sulfopyruvate decarboxylase TPP-binding subunit